MNGYTDTHQHGIEDEAAQAALIPAVTRFLKLLRYRRQTLLICVAASAALGAAFYCTSDRLYRSTAKLLIVQQRQDQVATVGDHESSDNTMATQRLLVTSPKVIEQAIENIDPRYLLDIRDTPPSAWNEAVSRRLSASTTRKTNFITVSYRSLHPEAAAAMVSAVTDAYLGFVEQTHKGTAADLVGELGGTLDERNGELRAKRAELDRSRRELRHLDVDQKDGIVDPIISRALRANEVYMAAQEKRQGLEATLNAVRAAVARGEDAQQYLAGLEDELGKNMMLASLGMGAEDLRMLAEQEQKLFDTEQELKRLARYLGPNHPQVQALRLRADSTRDYIVDYQARAGRRFAGARGGIGAAVQGLLEKALDQALSAERQLGKAFAQARDEAAQRSSDIEHLQSLQREVVRLEARRDAIEDRIASIDIRQEQAPISVTVVQEPVPDEKPISPQLRLVVVGSLFGGLLLGCLVVYVQDVLDDRFNSPEEITAQLGVPILAVVRRLEALAGAGLHAVHSHAEPTAVESEAFRTLRTSLSLNNQAAGRVLVSSSEPGDGKTTIAANTAVAYARAGKRTIVIDCDLRKPGLTHLMQLKGRAGVADMLADARPVAEAAAELLQRTELESLDVLPAGLRRPNPAELLSGPRLAELLAWAEAHYDQVIVDCPPVLAVSDAQIVGQLVDGAILVVRPESNHRRMVIRAVESFHATGCQVLGVVANGVSAESSGYGYGYGYGYGNGYGEAPRHQDEDDEHAPLEVVPEEVSQEDSAGDTRQTVAFPAPDSPSPIQPRRAASPHNDTQRRAA